MPSRASAGSAPTSVWTASLAVAILVSPPEIGSSIDPDASSTTITGARSSVSLAARAVPGTAIDAPTMTTTAAPTNARRTILRALDIESPSLVRCAN